MIVEDDAAIRTAIEFQCELSNAHFISFHDGFEASDYLALEKLPDPKPNIALLDIRLPGPWGIEISRKIRDHYELKNIPVVLMTAYELPGKDEAETLKEAGADQIMYKPLPKMTQFFSRSVHNKVLAALKDVVVCIAT